MNAAVTTIEGFAAVIAEPNIDTDQLLPGTYFAYTFDGRHGAALFGNRRYRADGSPDPDFVLNRDPWCDAAILIAGRNFGCGSSRESAVKALTGFGFRAIIAPSFSSIFHDNALQNALAPIVVDDAAVAMLAARAEAMGRAGTLRIDIAASRIILDDGRTLDFAMPGLARDLLIAGGDEVAVIMRHASAIAAFRAADRNRRPWVYDARLIPDPTAMSSEGP